MSNAMKLTIGKTFVMFNREQAINTIDEPNVNIVLLFNPHASRGDLPSQRVLDRAAERLGVKAGLTMKRIELYAGRFTDMKDIDTLVASFCKEVHDIMTARDSNVSSARATKAAAHSGTHRRPMLHR